MPPESATHTAIRDSLGDEALSDAVDETSQKYGRWSHTDLLLAQLIDLTSMVQWTLVALKSQKGKQPQPPTPYPRPGVRRRPRRTGFPTGAIKDYFDGMRAEHRRLVEEATDGERS
jgi:hypothetical protein